MLYDSLKILHILSATLLLMSMSYSYILWKSKPEPRSTAVVFRQLQLQTVLYILPLALIQLVTGFTMISLHEENLGQLWISGSFIGFIILMACWFAFIYFMLLAQQLPLAERSRSTRFITYRRCQNLLLQTCAFAVGIMIFLMANKVS